jgi:hypothetical protein
VATIKLDWWRAELRRLINSAPVRASPSYPAWRADLIEAQDKITALAGQRQGVRPAPPLRRSELRLIA